MSAESMVASGYAQASNLAYATSAAAQALINSAIGILNTYNPSYPTRTRRPAEAPEATGVEGFDSEKKPPNFPAIRDPSFPVTPSLGGIDALDATLTAIKPTLSLPKFIYRTLSEIPPFTDAVPDIDTTVDIPTAPVYSGITKPELLLLGLDDFHVDDITVPSFSPSTPTYSNGFEDDFYTAFSTGVSLTPVGVDDVIILMNKLFPNLSIDFEALSARVNGVLNRTETAFTDDFDARQYGILRQRIESERASKLQQLDDARSGGWELPGRVWATANRAINVTASQELSKAAAEVYVDRSKRELQHLQFVMGLAKGFYDSISAFVVQMRNYALEAFKASILFADTAVKFAHQVYELKQKDFSIRVSVLDAEIKLFEALMNSQLAKIEAVKQRLEVEKVKAESNSLLIQQYTAELNTEETKARIYTAQIEGLKAQLDAQKLPLDVFLSKVKAYEALTGAKRADYEILSAEIAGDKAKVEAELAKLSVYEAEIKAHESEVRAQSVVAERQIAINRERIDLYKTQVETQMELVRTDALQADHALSAYKAMADVFIAEENVKLANTKFEYEQQLENAKLDLETLRLDFDWKFKNIMLEMERLKSLASLHQDAATVEAGMANAAMSAMNAIVSASVSE